MIMGRPFATVGAPLVLVLAVLLIGPGRRGPLTPLVAVEGTNPPMGTAMAGGRLTITPQTAALTVMALKVMALKVMAR